MNKIIMRIIIMFTMITILNGFQYMSDRDKKELFELRNIRPPADAIELSLIQTFPSEQDETAGNYFISPRCMEIDIEGNYYIADQKVNAIYKYDSAGKYISRFGRPGQGPGDISLPMKIKVMNAELVVFEGGNMRLQYFDLNGNHKRIIKLFKSYIDLDILEDGSIIGAPLSLELQQDNYLLDILSQEGMLLRSFGAPNEYKYDRSVLNSRMIFAKNPNEVLVVYTYMSKIQRYSLQGHMNQEKIMETEFSKIKENINLRMNSYLPDKKVGYLSVFRKGTLLSNRIFVVDYISPMIWIWEIDGNLQIKKKYWAKIGESFFVRDIYVKEKGDEINFYLMGDLAEEGTKMRVFATKNK